VLTDEPNPEVRGYAAVALGMLKDTSALRLIRRDFDTTKSMDATGQLAIALGLYGEAPDGVRITTRFARGGSRVLEFNLVEALRLLGQVGPAKVLLAVAEDPEADAAPQAARALSSILAPNDGGKPERVKAFDHISGEDYLLAYVVDP
jgi:HEAT repeat protein